MNMSRKVLEMQAVFHIVSEIHCDSVNRSHGSSDCEKVQMCCTSSAFNGLMIICCGIAVRRLSSSKCEEDKVLTVKIGVPKTIV
jgi:hypothetical protein